MPAKSKRSVCKWCSKKILPESDNTWVHIDTHNSHSSAPCEHDAMPWDKKQTSGNNVDLVQEKHR